MSIHTLSLQRTPIIVQTLKCISISSPGPVQRVIHCVLSPARTYYYKGADDGHGDKFETKDMQKTAFTAVPFHPQLAQLHAKPLPGKYLWLLDSCH